MIAVDQALHQSFLAMLAVVLGGTPDPLELARRPGVPASAKAAQRFTIEGRP